MWPNPQETADLMRFTKEILNGKIHFLCKMIIFNALQGALCIMLAMSHLRLEKF